MRTSARLPIAYTICEGNGWVQEALPYNMLIVTWLRLHELASTMQPTWAGLLQ